MGKPRRRSPFTRCSVGLIVLLAASTLVNGSVAQDEAERVGSETCEGCHDDVVASFKGSVHWDTDPEGSCENCHGAGSSHAEEMDPSTQPVVVALDNLLDHAFEQRASDIHLEPKRNIALKKPAAQSSVSPWSSMSPVCRWSR